MDSHLIYNTTKKLRVKVEWPRATDTEWIYFGTRGHVNTNMVMQHLQEHFSEDFLYISWTRTNSFQTSVGNFLIITGHLLGVESFSAWNRTLTRVIEFNEIGVLRLGMLPALTP